MNRSSGNGIIVVIQQFHPSGIQNSKASIISPVLGLCFSSNWPWKIRLKTQSYILIKHCVGLSIFRKKVERYIVAIEIKLEWHTSKPKVSKESTIPTPCPRVWGQVLTHYVPSARGVLQALVLCGYWALEMWLVQLRKWIFILINLN